ncbi:MAG: ABC transporter permease [Proteobacteria bacterium]|jgi:lipooligosaccharide transport system permease protein|nr:ABC transporter permease [Pseudomonadota bacterium]
MNIHVHKIPSVAAGIRHVWNRNFLAFKKSWLVSAFWILLEPTFFLLAIGYGLGSFVPTIQGLSYADFFYPALLCTTSMMVSFFECSYANFAKLNYQKTYSTMILSPLRPQEIVLGEIFWGATKGFFSVLGVTVVATIAGHDLNSGIFGAWLILLINSVVFSALGMIIISLVRNYDGIVYPTSGFIIPMSLFSGTYYPLEQLPELLRYLSYLFPLTHSVALVRTLVTGGSLEWYHGLQVLFLLSLAVLLTLTAIQRIQKKIIQ